MVYLVGAGPGDYKLISVKGLEVIKEAEVIVYDRLVDERLLSYAPADAEFVYVGKASSRHTLTQDEINQVLVDKAKAGKKVVRLKGGDPFVFGRGGEEALVLRENQLDFEIIPGVTSAIAVPAYAGIPVTHRGIAASFAVITGHEDPAREDSAIKWDKLATAVDTLVFLMGVENLEKITTQLIAHGKPADTPAAVIRWGTKAEQEVLMTTVGTAFHDVAAAGIKPPAIFLVGHVAKLREKLAWFDNKPLFGKTVLVTRAREQASQLTEKLEKMGARCITAPAIEIKPPASYFELDRAIDEIHTYDWLIFTSVNGVEAFFTQLYAAGKDSRDLNLKVAAIGIATAEKLEAHGIKADLVPLVYRAEGIIEALEGRLPIGTKILIPRALVARDILPEKLREMGAFVNVVPAYQTVVGKADGEALAQKLANGEINVVTFASSSTVTNLLSLLGEGGKELVSKTKVACIGPITASTCLENGITPDVIADEYTMEGLTQAIVGLMREDA